MISSERYKVKWSSRFKKDYKLAMKRGYDINLLDDVIHLIARGDQQQKLFKEYGDLELGEIGKVTENCIFYRIGF